MDGVAALTAWSGLKADHFVRSEAKAAPPEPLAMISTYLRSDPNLTAAAATALDELVKAVYVRLRKRKSYRSKLSGLAWGTSTIGSQPPIVYPDAPSTRP